MRSIIFAIIVFPIAVLAADTNETQRPKSGVIWRWLEPGWCRCDMKCGSVLIDYQTNVVALLERFQSALTSSNWNLAASMCGGDTLSTVSEYGSYKDLFQSTIPPWFLNNVVTIEGHLFAGDVSHPDELAISLSCHESNGPIWLGWSFSYRVESGKESLRFTPVNYADYVKKICPPKSGRETRK